MVEKVLKIFFTVCKSELLDIVYSSHRIEENASAGAENGHNGAILGKKVQNSSSATTKSERMQVKMDIRKHSRRKNIQKQVTILKKPQVPIPKMDIMEKILRKKSKIHCMRPRKAKGC